jgi:L-proline amide hydrolase
MTTSNSMKLLPLLIILFMIKEEYSLGQESKEKVVHEDDAMPFLWSCDDMTPNLCDDLIVIEELVATMDNLKARYWRYRSKAAYDPSSNNLPVVVVNGGPGLSHNYDLPLKQLACRGREVLFYDQLSTGESKLPENTSIADDYPFLSHLEYFSQVELPAVIEHAELDEYHLLGDSYGSTISMNFALYSKSAARTGLVSMHLAGPVPSAADIVNDAWDPAANGIIAVLPDYVQSRLRAIQASGTFDSPELQAIELSLGLNHYYRGVIPPDCGLASSMNMNQELYEILLGKADYFPWTGTMRDLNMIPELGKLIDLPILLSRGEHDLISYRTMMKMHDILGSSEAVTFPRGGHFTILDSTGLLLDAVSDFLDRVESAHVANETFSPKRKPYAIYDPSDEARLFIGCLVLVAVAGLWIGHLVGKRRPHRAHYQSIL